MTRKQYYMDKITSLLYNFSQEDLDAVYWALLILNERRDRNGLRNLLHRADSPDQGQEST